MLLTLGAAFLFQVSVQVGDAPRRDRPSVVRDSAGSDSSSRSQRRRLAVTPEIRASAFHDAAARELFDKARAARIAQDSTLMSYDARVRTRMAASLGISSKGPTHPIYGFETAARVQWRRGIGARVEMDGARVAIPIAPTGTERDELLGSLSNGELAAVPYYPGYEPLWIGDRSKAGDVDERNIVNPIAVGAEAYYTYESGDSIRYRLPDKSSITLRELKVRPRSVKWNVAVGSLMFDVKSGQLVWAAYRLATPMDLWTVLSEEADTNKAARRAIAVGKGFVPTFKNELSEIVIEYSLHEARFWLPRSRTMRGYGQIGFARFPVTVDETFSYSNVNAGAPIPAIALNDVGNTPIEVPDSLKGEARSKWRDSAQTARSKRQNAFRDSLDKAPCANNETRTVGATRRFSDLTVAVVFPCDLERLASSDSLTGTIFSANSSAFESSDRDALIEHALSLAAQPPVRFIGGVPPTFEYGLNQSRYNRVEGFSTGLSVEQQLGGGYVASALGRYGFADHYLGGELSLSRTNLRQTMAITGYNRLRSANDWGDPLSFRSSVPAFLFGRDEGFYYRATGAELTWNTTRGPDLDWRLFAEHQSTARQRTSFSVGGSFVPNLEADAGASAGGGVRFTHMFGNDPRGLRAYTDLRLEAAGGDSIYGRGALDLTLARPVIGSIIGTMTLAGGSSIGSLPMQRRWFLGGTETIRGQRPDTAQSGNAFWFTRTELGKDYRTHRISVFGDVGWVGDRARMSEIGRPMSGVGLGFSVLDGALRLDVARGLFPRKQFRVDLSLGTRF
jgi:hypothetical protein